MIEKQKIAELAEEFIKETELFLVAVKVSSTNKITVLADSMAGITIAECVSLHRHIENSLDRDSEDFELQVSSPGLDHPFVVLKQYLKNEGKKIEVIDKEGSKNTGILKNVTTGGFELETEVKIKGRTKEKKDLSFNFDQIKTARELLVIK